MSSPHKTKEVMSLVGKVAVVSSFVSWAINCCVPFFDVLKGSKMFEWIDKYEQTFQALKEYLGRIPFLSKPIEGKKLYLYLAVSKEAKSTTFIREKENVQWPVDYVSKRLLDAKTQYPKFDKITLALVLASWKLRSYFHAHTIEILTNYPLCQVF